MMNNRFGKRTLIIGAIPKTIPKLGKMELIIKKAIPINTPRTILWLRLDDLCLPKIKGIERKSIIIVENGLNILSQYIFFCVVASRLFLAR